VTPLGADNVPHVFPFVVVTANLTVSVAARTPKVFVTVAVMVLVVSPLPVIVGGVAATTTV
jgi:hypothetical protein